MLGIGAPAVVAVIWGTFIAPKAPRPLPIPFRVSIEIDLFVLTAIALWFADAPEQDCQQAPRRCGDNKSELPVLETQGGGIGRRETGIPPVGDYAPQYRREA